MKKFIISGLLISNLIFSGCNMATRQFDGTQNINLPENKKLVNATWKENSLWLLTKDMQNEDIAETYKFEEDSNFGVMEGTVIIKENKTQ